MKNLLLFIAISFWGQFMHAQSIEFSEPEKLFDHPVGTLFSLAFIPLDYNKDGITDYIGRLLNGLHYVLHCSL